MDKSKQEFENLYNKLGNREFVIGLIMFEKEASRAFAERIYKDYMESKYVNSVLGIDDIIHSGV